MKRLLVLADSLSLPREQPEHCSYDNTWPQLLKRNFIVHQVSIGGATVKELLRQLEYHKAFQPDLVVIQSGIVDCAPRALSKLELEILSRYKLTRKTILKFIQSRATRFRKLRSTSYTPVPAYRATLEAIVSKLPGAQVFALSILPGNSAYEKLVPGIQTSIVKYNNVLQEVFKERYISLDDIDRTGIMSDHIHLNEAGQGDVYEHILTRIR
jgi:lysophospholipase L1-like esterase